MPHPTRREFLEITTAAAASLALPGCGSDPTAPDIPHMTARPGVPTGTPTIGLATALGLGGGSRDGFYYVPQSYDAAVPIPVLLVLHGAGGAADNWTSYVARAEARGFVLLAVDSRGSTWDGVRTSYGPDVNFLDDALALTFGLVRADPSRIGLAGFSDGASYGLSLGIANGDLFTHAIGYSPGFYDDPPRRGTPKAFVSHGTEDNILPFAITRDEIVPALRDGGVDVTFHPFAGGHTVPAEISEEALDWFLA